MGLCTLIAAHINHFGFMDVETYIDLCLFHPRYGYYTQNAVNPISKQGDFITAPEITSLFGEMLGLFFIHSWHQLACPKKIALIELGPGNGTLMKDILGVMKYFNCIPYVFLKEINPSLKKKQYATLAPLTEFLYWIDDFETLPPMDFTFIVGNEFLDTFPIQQVIKNPCGSFDLRKITLLNNTLVFQPHTHPIVERHPKTKSFMTSLQTYMKYQKSLCLLIDYGDNHPYDTRYGDTLQALHQHQFVCPLYQPGSADITHHVPFDMLETMVRKSGFRHSFIQTQRQFLIDLHIQVRYENAIKKRDSHSALPITQAVERLISPKDMGSLFKVFYFWNHPTLQPAIL